MLSSRRPLSGRPGHKVRFRPRLESLEERTLLTTMLTTTGADLIRFESATPAITTTLAVLGLGSGEALEGIDFRPATGELFGVGVAGSIARLLSISLDTGVATQVGATFAVAGADFGFDFNPTNDRLRVVSNAGINLLVDPNSGAVTTQTNLNPGTPNFVGAAYSNNFGTATTTTLFGIDSATDQLVIQNPPASGTLTPVGALGLDANGNTGFEVTGDGVAYGLFMLSPGIPTATLTTINLTTGAATGIGNVAAGSLPIRGLTAMRFVWDGGGQDDNWTTAANWVGDLAPSTNDDLVFPAGAARQATSSNDFLGGTNFNSITFTGSGYDLDGNGIILSNGMLDSAASGNNDIDMNIALRFSQIFSVAVAGETLFVGGTIGGNTGVNLAKEKPNVTAGNSGTLRFDGTTANAYAGTTTVNGGTLELAKVGVAAIPGLLVIGDGVGGALADIVQEITSGNIPDASDVVITSSGLLGLNAGVTETINNLNMTGGAVDTSTGSLTVNGTVTATGDGAGLGASIDGNLVVSSGTFNVDDAQAAVDDLEVNAVIRGAAGLSKNGTGRMVVSGANTYGGATVVNAGTLALGTVNGVPPTSQLTVQSAAVFDLNGFDQTVSALSGNGNIDNPTATSATIIVSNVLDVVFSGQIQGNLGLVKLGTGKLTLAGTASNTYAGSTTVGAGTLALGKSQGVAVPGNLVIGDGFGGLSADVLLLLQSEQIADTATVTINSSGLLNFPVPSLNRQERIGSLIMTGGRLAGDDTGSLYFLAHSLTATSDSQGNPARLAGILRLDPQVTHIFAVDDGPGATDLIVSHRLTDGSALKTGLGTLVLAGQTVTVDLTISDGTVIVRMANGTTPITLQGGILAGSGQIGSLHADGGVISPGETPGILRIGFGLTLGPQTTYRVELNGPNPGTGYDQLSFSSSPSIQEPTLEVSLGFDAPVGSQFIILDNRATSIGSQHFAGLTEGTIFFIAGKRFRITYQGGDGNDTVLIREDAPPPPPPPPPPGDFETFVFALYDEVLDREPDAAGFSFWVGALRSAQLNRVQVANAFLRSAERQVLVVESFYVLILNRQSDPLRVYWIDGLVSGRMTEADVAVGFVTSVEFTHSHPDDKSYVTDIYRILLDRPFGTSQAEIAFQLMALDIGLTTRAGMALSFLSSDEALSKAINAFYTTYLERTPAAFEQDLWFRAIRATGLDAAAVQSLFLGSDEFFQLVNG